MACISINDVAVALAQLSAAYGGMAAAAHQAYLSAAAAGGGARQNGRIHIISRRVAWAAAYVSRRMSRTSGISISRRKSAGERRHDVANNGRGVDGASQKRRCGIWRASIGHRNIFDHLERSGISGDHSGGLATACLSLGVAAAKACARAGISWRRRP